MGCLPNNLKEIPLTQRQVALVDADNYEWLMQWKWCAFIKRNYARRTISIGNGKTKTILMHRLIMGIDDPKIQVDHADRNGLNNYLSNLRLATHSQNGANRRSKINGTSKYLGVCLVKETGKWMSQIGQSNKLKYLGSFKNEIDAALAYDSAAIKVHGVFANLNFKTA